MYTTHIALFDDSRHHQQKTEKRHQRPRQSHPTGVIHIQGPYHGYGHGQEITHDLICIISIWITCVFYKQLY